MSERLAWAKKHGVTPPAYVLDAIQENPRRAADDNDCGGGCCCHCKQAAATKTGTSLIRRNGPSGASHESEMSPFSPAGRYVIAIKALECQGGPLGQLKTLPAVVPAAADFSMEPLLPSGRFFFFRSALCAIFAEVPVPPPRG